MSEKDETSLLAIVSISALGAMSDGKDPYMTATQGLEETELRRLLEELEEIEAGDEKQLTHFEAGLRDVVRAKLGDIEATKEI